MAECALCTFSSLGRIWWTEGNMIQFLITTHILSTFCMTSLAHLWPVVCIWLFTRTVRVRYHPFSLCCLDTRFECGACDATFKWRAQRSAHWRSKHRARLGKFNSKKHAPEVVRRMHSPWGHVRFSILYNLYFILFETERLVTHQYHLINIFFSEAAVLLGSFKINIFEYFPWVAVCVVGRGGLGDCENLISVPLTLARSESCTVKRKISWMCISEFQKTLKNRKLIAIDPD